MTINKQAPLICDETSLILCAGFFLISPMEEYDKFTQMHLVPSGSNGRNQTNFYKSLETKLEFPTSSLKPKGHRVQTNKTSKMHKGIQKMLMTHSGM